MTKKFTSIVLVGEPNSGKSTLLNALVGEKLSIVSPKVQTTRKTITGILIKDQCQIVVYDTPGIFNNPSTQLEKRIVENAKNTISENDNIYIVVDTKISELDYIQKLVQKINKPNISVLLNKIDITPYAKIDELCEQLKTKVKNVFKISALRGEGIDDFLNHISAEAEDSEWLYPEENITTIPERELAADITREKLFFKLHQELPYSLTVETELWRDEVIKNVRVVTINQVIYTKREGHKKIIIGTGGQNIKLVGSLAREELEMVLGCKVNLILFVKVRSNWEDLGIV
jgi:GTP-binding protein Era